MPQVRRWPVGRKSQLVAKIYDAGGQPVHRATHGLFMSAGALFLDVVQSDIPKDEAVETLLEWVEVVQQEAPGAVMGVVWTHIDVSATVSTSSLHRPRMLFSYSVSSYTGVGLDELREALTALIENQRLFPHFGAKVPLNYSMLERLAQEGRTRASVKQSRICAWTS
jgi:hypothetical protein